MASQALFTALELNLFDAIAARGDSGASIAQLKEACGVDAPRLQTLVTSLTAVKCLRRSAEGMYTLSPNAQQYMVSSSRHFYGDYLQYQMGRQHHNHRRQHHHHQHHHHHRHHHHHHRHHHHRHHHHHCQQHH